MAKSASAGQTSAEAVRQAERELARAHLHLDLATIDRLLHPDYVIVQPGGRSEGKAETLASLRAGDRRWEVARSDEMDVRVYGDAAVVTGRWTGRGRHSQERFDYQARFLSVWVRQDNTWRNVAYQSTPVE